MVDEEVRPAALAQAAARARACTRCPALVAARTRVVWGGGAPEARVLLVGDAPGAGEDELDTPLAGRPRRLLDELLAGAGLADDELWLTGLVKCRPPGNRDPSPAEVAACEDHLLAVVELVRPVVVVALGGAVAKLLLGGAASIRERRGREEARRFGDLPVWLYPVFHPAAAAYAPALTEQLRADLARLPALVAGGRPVLEVEPRSEQAEPTVVVVATPGQLELF